MTHTENDFFIVKYSPDGVGIPYFMDKEWNPELPSYDIYKKPPSLEELADKYNIKIKSNQLDGDFFVKDRLVSLDILNLCKELKINCITVPVTIQLYRNKTPKKQYFLFFLSDYISILDPEKSIFSISRDIYTDKLDTPEDKGLDKIYYEKIDKFHIKEDISKHLFFCQELSKPVCSNVFKEKFESLNLKGVEFEIIDDNYKYDAWDGF
ncbi:imm11 family protein [Xenorhabdus kozodoii]|uniref:Immunity MXAN-0049 protein domain-containing protein n=1 Tax=Xenorhabdus kozodoii TaxID=351676 RepID=A0A2D0LBP6_9GAMM|nr:DUF1629 domain-containing protein [Xenorhabdus kozodoii]PHM73080.1 hypothetical protein Xkoz_02178 [Xenorhabdus kozodoii]